MKNRFIELLAFAFGLLTTVAGFLTLPQIALLPESLQPYIGLALALVIVGKNGAYVILDFVDDGKLNKSYRHGALGLLLVGGLLLGLTSCATRDDGTKTFIGLDRREWLGFGKDVGQAAVKAAVPAYLARRSAAGGKEVQDVYIADWTLSK
jgi:hypothetical protein